MDSVENGEVQDEDDKDQVRDVLVQITEDADEDTLDTERISDNVFNMEKAKTEENDEESSSRRKRRAVSEPTPVVEEKTQEQVKPLTSIG
jgi:hypothetical protein